MLVLLAFALFLSLTLMIFAFSSATLAPGSSLQERLRVLLGRKMDAQAKPDMRDRMEQALEPLSKVLPRSLDDVSRTRGWLIEAGLRDARYGALYYGIRV